MLQARKRASPLTPRPGCRIVATAAPPPSSAFAPVLLAGLPPLLLPSPLLLQGGGASSETLFSDQRPTPHTTPSCLHALLMIRLRGS